MLNSSVGLAKFSGGKTIVKRLSLGKFDDLSSQILSEETLKKIADGIKRHHSNSKDLLATLLKNIPELGKKFDWNTGSVLQHFDPELVIKCLKEVMPDYDLYGSIGLCWVLGELRSTNPAITNFLYLAVKHSGDPESWWRAAFSLEKLGLEDAVNLLKNNVTIFESDNIDNCLDNLTNKRSLIKILLLSNSVNVETKIYPRVKETFLESTDDLEIINCCWLIGRLGLVDREIVQRLKKLVNHRNYELKYYTFFALQENAVDSLQPFLVSATKDVDPLIRKMAVRGILSIGNLTSIELLENLLLTETNESVVSEITIALNSLENPLAHSRAILRNKAFQNENGLVVDESDKWYGDPAIYDIFSEAEDPENICFDLILRFVANEKITNPIDLASGTGRIAKQLLNKVDFGGTLFAVDINSKMCDFLGRTAARERRSVHEIKIVESSTLELPKKIPQIKSNFIISCFGFPSKISDTTNCYQELRAVYDLLSGQGHFFTIGWDETYDDELSYMWYKFISGNNNPDTFEEWKQQKQRQISSPRNCNLSWFKRAISSPLQFNSLKESVHVMGHLFGRDAAKFVLKNNRTEWSISMGITHNTKEEIADILEGSVYK